MDDIWFVKDFNGVQKGTKDNPFSPKTAQEYDAQFASLQFDADGWHVRNRVIRYGPGEFLTWGCYEFGDFATKDRPRIGPSWQVLLSPDTVISLDPNLPDSYIGNWPLRVYTSASQWQQYLWWGREQEWIDLTPEQLWAGLSECQLVKGGTINLNFEALAQRWMTTGWRCCLSAGLLQGHGPAWEDVHVTNFGTHKPTGPDGKPFGPSAENFPLSLAGAVDGYDRNKLAKLDPTKYIFSAHLPDEKCPHHTGCSFSNYNEIESNDQISCHTITGSIGQPTVHPLSAGDETSPFVNHYHKYAYQQNNKVDLPETHALRNLVQGFTIYNTLRGDVSKNLTRNCQAFYYSDFFQAKAVDVHDNEALRTLRGACWFLSDGGPDSEHFSSVDHKFRRNKVTFVGMDVDYHGGVFLWNIDRKPPSPDRYLGRITIGGEGEENDFSFDGPPGTGNIAIHAINADRVTIGFNKYGDKLREIVLTNCTNVTRPSLWQRFVYWLKRVV